MDKDKLKLYLVTDRRMSRRRDICDIVSEAVAGGVTMVQLREKSLCTREFVEMGKKLKNLLEPFGVPLLINDRVDVALACGADGVHLGQSDMDATTARSILGKEAIIGLSIEHLDEIFEANKLDIDYVGVSPVFNTLTKTDIAPALGLKGLECACIYSDHPVVGIGGITRDTAADVIKAGADGIAVVSAIVAADDPRAASAELLRIVT